MDTNLEKLFNVIKNNQIISRNEISCILNRSERTIIKYIDDLNTIIVPYGARIVGKRNGYKLDVFDLEKHKLFSGAMKTEDNNEKIQRINKIVLILLNTNDCIKIDELCDMVSLSRTQLKNDLKEAKGVLNEYHITVISSKQGIRANGQEIDKRLCLSHHCSGARKADADRAVQISKIKEIVSCCLANANYKMSDESFSNLAVHLFIAIERMKNNHSTPVASDVLIEQKKYNAYQVASNITALLSKFFDVDIDESETAYVCIHLRSKQIIDGRNDQMLNDDELNSVFSDMMANIEKVYSHDLSSNLNFVIAIYQHLLPLLVRIKYKTFLTNPLINEIKKKFLYAYEIAGVASQAINEKYDIVLPEDEVGFLALHIETVLEKEKYQQRKKVLIVCGSGKGTANLLKVKVEKEFNNYLSDIVLSSAFDVEKNLDATFDVIFTTVDLNVSTSIPVIKINSLSDIEGRTIADSVSPGTVKKYLRPELFIRDSKLISKGTVLESLINAARSFYALPDDFEQKICAREEYSPTEFDSMIAIPHPVVPCSDKTFIAMAVLDEPIAWDKMKVRIVLLLSIAAETNGDIDDLYEMITDLINNRILFESVVTCRSYYDLCRII